MPSGLDHFLLPADQDIKLSSPPATMFSHTLPGPVICCSRDTQRLYPFNKIQNVDSKTLMERLVTTTSTLES